MPSRKYKSTASATTLGGAMLASTSGATDTMQVNSTSSFPNSFPFTLVVAPDTISEEIVTVTGAPSSGTYPVIRGEDGTNAVAHSAGDDVRHMITARDLQEPQDHIYASSGVHGLTGSVVGTSDTQTLTNKAINATSLQIAGVDAVDISSSQTLTNKTLTTPIINGGEIKLGDFTSPLETYTIDSSAAPASTANLYLDDSTVKYFTVTTTNDFILNITRNSGASPTLDSFMSTGNAVSAAVMFVNGSSARKVTSITIDGSTSGVTVKWGNSVAYPAANTNSIMVFTLNIVKTGAGTFTIFAS